MYLLKSDVAEFEPYRTNLQELTIKEHDTSPCWKIFARFMERATERVDYVTNLLATEKFDFSGDDKFIANRHSLPYAQDMAEAREFWRQELRCEYLDQLLASPDIQFTGPLTFDDKGAEVALTRDKTHPLSFDYLPKAFLSKDGRQIAWLNAGAGASNVTVRVDLPSRDNLKENHQQFLRRLRRSARRHQLSPSQGGNQRRGTGGGHSFGSEKHAGDLQNADQSLRPRRSRITRIWTATAFLRFT